jgi:hypothetical protein
MDKVRKPSNSVCYTPLSEPHKIYLHNICVCRYTRDYFCLYGSTVLVDLGRFFNFLIDTQFVGLLGRGISPSQGSYLHTEQNKHRINAHRLLWLEWDSNLSSQGSSGQRRFMPWTGRPLWSAHSWLKLTYFTNQVTLHFVWTNLRKNIRA